MLFAGKSNSEHKIKLEFAPYHPYFTFISLLLKVLAM